MQLNNKPDNICNDCLTELKGAVSFKQKCENSDSFLRNINLQIFDKFDDDFIDTNLFEDDDYDLKPDFEEIFDTNSKSQSSGCSEKSHLVDSSCQVDALAHTGHKKKSSKKFTIQCPTCEEEFSGPSKLIIHAKNEHQDLKPFKCLECTKCFQNPKSLKVHKRSHGNEKRFKCNECSLQFHVKANLISHARTHSGKV